MVRAFCMLACNLHAAFMQLSCSGYPIGMPASNHLGPQFTLDSLNPTGSVFADYAPQTRATAPIGGSLTTLAETHGVHPDTPLTIHRGAPAHQQSIVPGDFVTDMHQLAKDYAGSGRVLSLDTTYGDVLDDADEPGGGEYIYRPRATP